MPRVSRRGRGARGAGARWSSAASRWAGGSPAWSPTSCTPTARSRASSASAIRSIRRGGRSSCAPRISQALRDAGADLPGHARPVRDARGGRGLRAVAGDRDPLARGRRPRPEAAQGGRPGFDRGGPPARRWPARSRPGPAGCRADADRDLQHQRRRTSGWRTCSPGWRRREPDVVCLQELKAADAGLPARGARGGGLRRGLARAAGLERRRDPRARRRAGPDPRRAARRSGRPPARATSRRRSRGVLSPRSTRRTATRSRGRSSTTSSPGMQRLRRARGRAAGGRACRWCWPATTTSCPSRATSIRPRSYDDNALVQPESRARPIARLLDAGLDRRAPRAASRRAGLHLLGLPAEPLGARRRACGSTISCSSPELAGAAARRRASTAPCAGGRTPATTRRSGSSSTSEPGARARHRPRGWCKGNPASRSARQPLTEIDSPAHRLSVAPMMDWTDRHCRFFHRPLHPADAALYRDGDDRRGAARRPGAAARLPSRRSGRWRCSSAARCRRSWRRRRRSGASSASTRSTSTSAARRTGCSRAASARR